MALFPLFADLQNQPCLVVGGGVVAHRKTLQLLTSGALVTVNAPQVCEPLQELADLQRVRIRRSVYAQSSLDGVLLVIAATSDGEVNAQVASDARARQILCNVVDDAQQSGFIMPATIRREPVTIAISTAGAAPVLARWIKASIESWLPARIGLLARFAERWRPRVMAQLGSMQKRRVFWESVFNGPIADTVMAGRDSQATSDMGLQLAAHRRDQHRNLGVAWLVGAGPGDPSLITVRGKQLLQRADVVLYDRLVSPEILEFARREAELIDVGKGPGQSDTQTHIEQLLVEHVRAGKQVCRLKGGDPLVFGRGGEELAALDAAGLDYQIVPGVTAALSCAAYAGIPLTHRDLASSVSIATGHRAADAARGLPAAGQHTLALYMSVGRLPQISAELQSEGYAPSTPCAIVENGTSAHQRVLRGRLDNIASAAGEHNIRPPAMLFVGNVAALAGRHAWFEPAGFIDARQRPAGRVVAI